MFASCILRQLWYFFKVLLAVGMEAHGRPLNSYWMFTECSLNVHWMFTECSLNVPGDRAGGLHGLCGRVYGASSHVGSLQELPHTMWPHGAPFGRLLRHAVAIIRGGGVFYYCDPHPLHPRGPYAFTLSVNFRYYLFRFALLLYCAVVCSVPSAVFSRLFS
jgi:hypothetical protein